MSVRGPGEGDPGEHRRDTRDRDHPGTPDGDRPDPRDQDRPDPGGQDRPGPGGPARQQARAPLGYRMLLLLMPPRWRREHGPAAERLVLDMLDERRRSGRRAGTGFWIALAWDAIGNGSSEWLRFRRHRRTGPKSGEDMMSSFWYDLRHAGRSLSRQPLYAFTVVLLTALGVGGNAAVFRAYDGLFLRPLPFAAPERLVDLDTRAPRWNLEYTSVAYADFVTWREQNRTFEAMGVYDTGGASLVGTEGAVRVSLIRATHDLAATLSLEPVLGRLFTESEDVPDGPAVALLTHAFWTREYAADPGVVGRIATLDDTPYEIVGVLPPEASFVAEADLWLPLGEDPDRHDTFSYQGIGRLRPNVDIEEAEQDLTRAHKAVIERWSVNEITFPVVSSVRDRYLGEARAGLNILLGAVIVVLLLACANIAGLTLVRALGRRQEVGIRLALGAGRARVVRHLLAESVVLSIVGGLVGGVSGVWASGLVVGRLGSQLPTWVTFDVDVRFALLIVALTVATAALFSMAPALRLSETEAGEAFNAGSTRRTSSRDRMRATSVLVGGQVALASLLLVLSGVSLRDARALLNVDPGFRTDGVLAYTVQLPTERFGSSAEWISFWDEHMERVGALPGVLSAGASTLLPLQGHSGYFFEADGAPPRGDHDANPVVLVRAVTPGYLETMDVQIVRGRAIVERDGREETGGSVAVNESFAREFLSHVDDPVGARVRTGGGEWWTVIAVTRDTRPYGLEEAPRPAVWVPMPQLAWRSMTVALYTGGEPSALAGAARAVLAEQAPGVAMYRVTTMAEIMEEASWGRRASTLLIFAFAAAALVLAVAGLYGTISYGVRQRASEIGIRMALGARGGQVASRVLRDGMMTVGVGLTFGLAIAFTLAPLVGATLFEASPRDPLVYGGVLVVVSLVAAAATLLPARKAASLDPVSAMRTE